MVTSAGLKSRRAWFNSTTGHHLQEFVAKDEGMTFDDVRFACRPNFGV